MAFARMVRLLKLGKIFRIVRAFRFLKDLRVMLASILSSFQSLMWSFVLLIIFLFMVSLIFVQLLAGHLIELNDGGQLPEEYSRSVNKHFGGVGQSMLSLYQATTGGIDWIDLYEIVSKEGAMSCMTMVFFVAFWHFSMLNIVTGLVMEQAVRNATPDREELMLEQRRAENQTASQLKDLFVQMDKNGDMTLSLEEFVEFLGDTQIRTYVASLGLSIQDAEMFFRVLRNVTGNDELPISDFVEHCSRMKGYAMAIDLHQLTFEVKVLRRELTELGSCIATALHFPNSAKLSRRQ